MLDLHTTIRNLIIEAAELDEDTEIGLTDSLHDHDVDSLAGLEVTVNLEKKYQIKIPPARYEELVSIGAIAAIVQELIDAKAGTAAQVAQPA
ncbi:acyl carrier protein [Massilia sp. Dwa41.01b]|uniref:acyl carrier protein n=1 Tax=unclassified Massilia TaxID=2609279 RepID=UPI0016009346|nr:MULTISPECIES: acyl carrier protein [unclassified Massilia]QNA87327.1 acyl carrier protein [Massilia sp. Dwa41.01b]QNA98236.1 acyl carrier protein [Massilia sp. Se16.2.3]